MAEIVTYRNDAQCCFCQLKLESRERIFVQFALDDGKPKILINRMGLGGYLQKERIWEMEWALENMETFVELFGEVPELPPPARGALAAVVRTVQGSRSIAELQHYLDQKPRAGLLVPEALEGYAGVIHQYFGAIHRLQALVPQHESALPEPKEVIQQALQKYFQFAELREVIGTEALSELAGAIRRLWAEAAQRINQPGPDFPQFGSAEEEGTFAVAVAYTYLSYFIPSVEEARLCARVYSAVFGSVRDLTVSDSDLERERRVLGAVEHERQQLSDDLRRLTA